MQTKIEFTDQASKDKIISDNPTLFLWEEQNYIEGNFLVMSDVERVVEPVYIDISRVELEVLKTNQTLIQEALNELIMVGV